LGITWDLHACVARASQVLAEYSYVAFEDDPVEYEWSLYVKKDDIGFMMEMMGTLRKEYAQAGGDHVVQVSALTYDVDSFVDNDGDLQGILYKYKEDPFCVRGERMEDFIFDLDCIEGAVGGRKDGLLLDEHLAPLPQPSNDEHYDLWRVVARLEPGECRAPSGAKLWHLGWRATALPV